MTGWLVLVGAVAIAAPREAVVALRPVASLPAAAELVEVEGELWVRAEEAPLVWRSQRLLRQQRALPDAPSAREPGRCPDGSEGVVVDAGSARGVRCGDHLEVRWTHREGSSSLRLHGVGDQLTLHGDSGRLVLLEADAQGLVARVWEPSSVTPLRWVLHALPIGEPVVLPRWSPERSNPEPALRISLRLPAGDTLEQALMLRGGEVWVRSRGAEGQRLLMGRLPPALPDGASQ